MRVGLKQVHECRKIWPVLSVVMLLWLSTSQASAAALYKWVDDDGSVHYSSRLPPEQNRKAHQQLNSQGVVLSTSGPAKTEEELANDARLAEEQREAERLKEIQDKKDRVLLLTFSSEEELELARDNRLEVIDSVIRLIQKNIETTQEKLDQLIVTADNNYVSKGKEVPGGLAQKIEHFDRKIANRIAQLQAKTTEREKLRQVFDEDLERFRLLKSASN